MLRGKLAKCCMNSVPRSFDEEYVLKYVEQSKVPPEHPFYRLYMLFRKGDEHHSYIMRRCVNVTDKVKEVFGEDLRRKRILDFGCGSGWLTVGLAEAGGIAIGVDVDRDFVRFARERARYQREENTDFVVCDGAHLPFQNYVFDFVVAIDVIEHVKLPGACLLEGRRALKENGLLYFEVPNRLHFTLFRESRTNARDRLLRWYHRRRGEKIFWHKHGFCDFETLFTYGTLIQLLKESGFDKPEVLPPSLTKKSRLVSLLWRLGVVKWFKLSFSVIAQKAT